MADDVVPDRHEAPNVNTRRVLGLTLGFVAFALLLGIGLQVYYRFITAAQTLTVTVQDFPAPRLEPNPTRDYDAVRAAQQRERDGLRWVDQAKGIVHVPVGRAMALVAARGAAAFDPVPGTPLYPLPGQPPLDGAPRAAPQPLAFPYGDVR